ncbi:hypothetical protein HB662_18445 [Roseomonas frigidaquae]|uniref:Flagellar FliJ protein n=1 Tax=Falsiroseomonas frigidaquae TaxID=487318 RepID=A0ABX1F345_9PROT|nr:hypothetical protein [Falsiroseomonas frigidaquae]NKE46767.1 hypothetical protein [Falsiroseomonas frigidaquae]
MPRPDPLRALGLLRRLELEEARRSFAGKLRAEDRAAVALDRVTQELAAEVGGAAAAAYAAWLPGARARVAQAATLHTATDAALTVAQQAVAVASRAEQLVVEEAARRARDRRAARHARADRLLGDLGGRPVKPPSA